MSPAVPAPLLAACVVLATWLLTARNDSPARSHQRLRRLSVRGDRGEGVAAAPSVGQSSLGLSPTARMIGALGAAALCVVLLGRIGALVAPVVGLGTWLVLGRLEPAAVRRRRIEVLHGLPAATDLLLACVAAGATPTAALSAVSEALEGVVGETLRQAALAHTLGLSFADVAADLRADPVRAPLAAMVDPLARSEDTGVPLSRALRQLAEDVRAERGHRTAAAARQAGVRTAAPLGLCFLPAFVLIGLVPVVITAATSAAF